jgi:hypothetical protein
MARETQSFITQLRQASAEELLKRCKGHLLTCKVSSIVMVIVLACTAISLFLPTRGSGGLLLGMAVMFLVVAVTYQVRVWFIDLVLSDRQKADVMK